MIGKETADGSLEAVQGWTGVLYKQASHTLRRWDYLKTIHGHVKELRGDYW